MHEYQKGGVCGRFLNLWESEVVGGLSDDSFILPAQISLGAFTPIGERTKFIFPRFKPSPIIPGLPFAILIFSYGGASLRTFVVGDFRVRTVRATEGNDPQVESAAHAVVRSFWWARLGGMMFPSHTSFGSCCRLLPFTRGLIYSTPRRP